MVTNGTTYDSVVWTKDTRVIRDLQIDGDQWKAEKKLNKLNWPITKCFPKTNKSWIEYRAPTKIFAYRIYPIYSDGLK